VSDTCFLRRMPRLAERVFPSFPSWHTLEADISRAGLVKTNTEGTLCFHSFRKMLATELERAGVGLKTAAAAAAAWTAAALVDVHEPALRCRRSPA
jgi:hypothetical protein